MSNFLSSNTTKLGLGILFTSAGLYFSGQLSLGAAIVSAMSGILGIIVKGDGETKNIPIQDINIPKGG